MASTPLLGFGLAPAGVSPFGYGSVATADPNVGQALTKADGTQGEARHIDPRTRDYAFDSSGRVVGIDSVQQQVYLALVTVRGSASVAALGHTFANVSLVTSNIQTQLNNEVAKALSKLIADNLVELVDVRLEMATSGAALVHVVWKDLTKDTTQTISL